MRLRLILSYMLVATIAISVVMIVARQSTENEVSAFMFRGSMTDSTELAASLEDYYRTNGSWLSVEKIFPAQGRGQSRGQGMMGGMMGQRIKLADSQGDLMYDNGEPKAGGSLSPAERRSAIPLEVDDETVGYLIIEGGMVIDNEDGKQLIGRLNNAAMIAALVAGAFSLVLAFFLANRMLRPIESLTHSAKRLGDGDLTQRVHIQGADELAFLGSTFNQMAESLENAEEGRRAMTADIAHELRNPLAVQRANLEALQDGIYPLTTDNLGPIIEQNLLLNRLVDDLRTLALADAGQLELDVTQIDLLTLTNSVIERHQPGALDQGVMLALVNGSTDSEKQYKIIADAMRVEQILGNLISNALRFTPEGGKIRFRLAETPDSVRLTIHDGGPGIPDESLPYIFERFYRADSARSRKDGGTGLGLAIAKQLAEEQKGSLTAGNYPRGGALFSLSLPKGSTILPHAASD